MANLKIIFYGILAFIERNPIFCVMMPLIALFAPFVFKWMLWVILGLVLLALIGFIVMIVRMRRMQNQMNEQFRQTNGAGGFSGFGGFSNVNGMSLEELVRQMQAQADAQQRKNTTTQEPKNTKIDNDKSGDYVDFEEVK